MNKDIKCPKCSELLINKGTWRVIQPPSFEMITKEKLYCTQCKKNYAGEELKKTLII